MELFVINSKVIIFHDGNDEDIKLGLSLLWETYKTDGCHQWLNGEEVYANNFQGIEPCDVILINHTLPIAVLNVLRFNGFRLIYVGNQFSPMVTFADTISYDICIIIHDAYISAILHAYYVYLQHSRIGNRLNFLPSKLVSDSLNFIYNNKINELTTFDLCKGVFIAGLNGPILKQNVNGPITMSRSMEYCLHTFVKDRGNFYV